MADRSTKVNPEARVVLLPDGVLYPLPAAARAIANAVQDTIERSCPTDAEFRVELAREIARLLPAGVLGRLQR